jgi:hypothetical protein
MSFAMASLLAHSDSVPPSARVVIHAAHEGPVALRPGLLESAAQILHREAGIDCADARELVDLLPGGCGE